ncbi:MAG: hypothetical protein QXI22_01440 [Sulfolobales archaeon]
MMGLSNAIASGLMLLAVIQVFVVITHTAIDLIAWVSRDPLRLSSLYNNDLCSITGVRLLASGSSITINANISNTGSIGWWDYNKSHVVLEILLTDGSKILSLSRISDLQKAIYNDKINPGIVDPGEVLSINYTLDSIDPNKVYSFKVIFSTQNGGICVSTGG